MMNVLKYDPALEAHPAYNPDRPDVTEGDIIRILAYRGMRSIRFDGGIERYLTDSQLSSTDEDKLVDTGYLVHEVKPFKIRVGKGLSDGGTGWIPEQRVVDIDAERKEELLEMKRQQEEYRALVSKRKETDMDLLMEEVVIPHARRVCEDVWPGGTVDVDEIEWFWNPQLTNSAGMAYYGSAVPETLAGDAEYAIGLAPAYYYQHGVDELLEVVRHELIHQWQFQHPDGGRGIHGPKFKQWVDDLNTSRHCKHWSK